MQNNSRIRPIWGNCSYTFFKAGDYEIERCKLVGRFHKTKINPLAREMIERLIERMDTTNINFCEYHQPAESLKNLIDYGLSVKKRQQR